MKTKSKIWRGLLFLAVACITQLGYSQDTINWESYEMTYSEGKEDYKPMIPANYKIAYKGDAFEIEADTTYHYKVLYRLEKFYSEEGDLVNTYRCVDPFGTRVTVYSSKHLLEWSLMFMYPQVNYIYYMNEIN